MKKSFSISFMFIFFCTLLFAQKNINSYKYILVPKQFEFQNAEDQYQLNSLTNFLFKKSGYTVLYTDEQYPEDLATNSCLALKVKVNKNSSLFTTKMMIDLYDCRNNIVYATKEGVSKEKEYKKAYQEAIRNAFVDIEELNYAYNSTLNSSSNLEAEPEEAVVTLTEVKAPIIKSIEPKEVAEPILKEIKPVAKAKVVKLKKVEEAENAPLKIAEKPTVNSIEGKYIFENWGVSTISKKGDDYNVIGGDENFEFATIYKTSKSTIFILKWVAFKQPQLLEINSDGDLEIDTESGVKTYSRVK